MSDQEKQLKIKQAIKILNDLDLIDLKDLIFSSDHKTIHYFYLIFKEYTGYVESVKKLKEYKEKSEKSSGKS